MSMEMTWLDFQLSTDNQNGRHLAIFFFFEKVKSGCYIHFDHGTFAQYWLYFVMNNSQ